MVCVPQSPTRKGLHGGLHGVVNFGTREESLIEKELVVARVGLSRLLTLRVPCALRKVGALCCLDVYEAVKIIESEVKEVPPLPEQHLEIPVVAMASLDTVIQACISIFDTQLCVFRLNSSPTYGRVVSSAIKDSQITCDFPALDYGSHGYLVFARVSLPSGECWYPVGFVEGFVHHEGTSLVACRLLTIFSLTPSPVVVPRRDSTSFSSKPGRVYLE